MWLDSSLDIGKGASSISLKGICLSSKWEELQRYHAPLFFPRMISLSDHISSYGKKEILRVMIVGKSLMFRMRRTSWFVISAIKHAILERLVGDSMVSLLGVEEFTLVEVLGLELIVLQPLIKLLLQALLLLTVGLSARKNWKPSVGWCPNRNHLLLHPLTLHI
jgi:hypothetical protein